MTLGTAELIGQHSGWRILTAVALLGGCLEGGDSRGRAGSAEPEAELEADPAPLHAGPPRVRLGSWAGEGQTDFYDIAGAVVDRGADVLVVANRGDATIRTFGLDGEWRSTQGGIGGGPREFQDLTALFNYRGDSLIAFDEDTDVASVWPYSGGDVRRVPAPPLPPDSLRYPRLRGALADGRLVWTADAPHRQPDEVGESHPEPRVVFLTSAEGTEFAPVAETTGMRYFRYAGAPYREGRAPFSPRSFALTRDSLILFGSTERARAERITGAGVPVEPLVFSLPSAPVAAVHREWHITRRRAVLNRPLPASFREGQTAVLEILPFPDSFPALGDIIAGEDGRIWVTGYRPPATDSTRLEEETTVWSVYTEPGSRGRDIEFPGRFRLLWADETEVVGVVRDEFDIEHVLIVPLPPAAGSAEP